jgi:prevent-host-death family protein
MKVENIREVKTRFSHYVKELTKSGSVLITKNGRPCAALIPVTEETDLEALALSLKQALLENYRRRHRARKERRLCRFGGALSRDARFDQGFPLGDTRPARPHFLSLS